MICFSCHILPSFLSGAEASDSDDSGFMFFTSVTYNYFKLCCIISIWERSLRGFYISFIFNSFWKVKPSSSVVRLTINISRTSSSAVCIITLTSIHFNSIASFALVPVCFVHLFLVLKMSFITYKVLMQNPAWIGMVLFLLSHEFLICLHLW